MKIAHQVSQRMVEKLTASTAVQTVTFDGLKDMFYRDTYSHKVKDNTYLIMLPNCYYIKRDTSKIIEMAVDYGVNEIVFPFDGVEWITFFIRDDVKAAREQGIKICAGISDPKWYEYAAEIEELDGIVFDIVIKRRDEGDIINAPGGWHRFKSIYSLVKSGKFDSHRSHRLIGMRNPAEMVAYKRAFSDFIYSSISVVITNMCYIYSAYGVSLSRENGVYLQPVILPEFDELDNIVFSSEQESLYFLNKEIMDEFARGIGGDKLMKAYAKQAVNELADLDIDLGGKS